MGDKPPSICVITPTIGRPTLKRALESATPGSNDEWLVMGDGSQPQAKAAVSELQAQGRGDLKYFEGLPSGNYGNTLRDIAMAMSDKDYFIFLDDDDIFIPDIWPKIKQEIARYAPYPVMFRMVQPEGGIIWKERIVTPGNISGSMFCVPNVPKKTADWGKFLGHGCDAKFIEATMNRWGVRSLCWSGEIIIICKPEKQNATNGN